MHTMTCSHHSTPFLNDFKLYPSSFHHPKTQRYTHFHLSPKEHILISYFSQLRILFFLFTQLFFSFILKEILFINTRTLFFFISPVAFFPFLTLLGSFLFTFTHIPIPRSKSSIQTQQTILSASSNEDLVLAKDKNKPLSLLILSRFCT